MRRRSAGRATRQILSGADLEPPRDATVATGSGESSRSLPFTYLVALSILIVASALAWALWGMAPASILLLLLAVGLIGSWLVL
jgi:hypothetical protein